MDNELITVIVLCYNHKNYLDESIAAVYAQTYPNIQLIVTDDFSTDGSAELIKKLSEGRKFEIIINEKNKGLNVTLADALSHAKGEYISIISADDYMLPEKTAKQFTFLKKYGKDGVYSNGYSLTATTKELIKLNPVFSSGDNQQVLNYIYQYDWGAPLLQSGLFHKDVFIQTLPLRMEYKSDDWAFIIKAFEKFNIGFLNEPLFCYRLHSDNTFKKYWFTLPMRIDVVSRLIPENYRSKAIANILLSHGQHMMANNYFLKGIRFQLGSLAINFSGRNLVLVVKSMIIGIRNKFKIKS